MKFYTPTNEWAEMKRNASTMAATGILPSVATHAAHLCLICAKGLPIEFRDYPSPMYGYLGHLNPDRRWSLDWNNPELTALMAMPIWKYARREIAHEWQFDILTFEDVPAPGRLQKALRLIRSPFKKGKLRMA